jgi:glyoxylase-like metal-dependent hydrolase (beta-lactamase superfamily II)
MKATFLGHATVYLETSDTKILIDPFLTGNPKAAAKASDLNPEFIVLTHGHSDHTADAVPIAKRTGATIIATFELGEWLATAGSWSHPKIMAAGINRLGEKALKIESGYGNNPRPAVTTWAFDKLWNCIERGKSSFGSLLAVKSYGV